MSEEGWGEVWEGSREKKKGAPWETRAQDKEGGGESPDCLNPNILSWVTPKDKNVLCASEEELEMFDVLESTPGARNCRKVAEIRQHLISL